MARARPRPELAPAIKTFLNFDIMNKNFQFISFEGIEGCGKSTQAKKLYEYFLSKQIDCLLTREPGGSLAGEKIRGILLDEEIDKLSAKSELLLNFASRIEHVEKVIKPALKSGKIVICDRFVDSTFAYQGSAMGIAFEEIEKIQKIAIGEFMPDITFLINVSVDEAFARISARGNNNRYEKLGNEFHQKVYEGFFELAKKNSRINIVDGTQNQQQVFQKILNIINQN
jgi:dTMP kinase